MSKETLNITLAFYEDAQKKIETEFIKYKSEKQISSTLYNFPLYKLLNKIKNMKARDGTDASNLILEGKVIQRETGWNDLDALQIESILLKCKTSTII